MVIKNEFPDVLFSSINVGGTSGPKCMVEQSSPFHQLSLTHRYTQPMEFSFVSIRSCELDLRSAARAHSPAANHRRRKLSEVSWSAYRKPHTAAYSMKHIAHIVKSRGNKWKTADLKLLAHKKKSDFDMMSVGYMQVGGV